MVVLSGETASRRPASRALAARLRPLVAVLRVHQWVKNLLVFVPVILDHKLFHLPVLSRAFLAFAAFSCAASSSYILNDLVDVQADREHPGRRGRPFAARTLAPSHGLALLALLVGAAVCLALPLHRSFVALLLGYLGLTTAYSLYLKRLPIVDVLLLAGFYTLRVLAGLAATRVRFSTWLLAFSMFLFLSLASVKRFAELSRLAGGEQERVARRGYVSSDRDWLGSMGATSGYLSVLVLALYISSDQVVALYRKPDALWLLCPLLLYWISRMWLLVHRGRLHDDPIVATLRDPVSYGIGALIAAILVAAV